MFESSFISISKSAYLNNLEFIRKQLRGARLCSVVKGNAYGHGLLPFVTLADEVGVDYFAVYSADEAYTLVSSISNDADLFIMGMVEGDAIPWAIENHIEFCVHDMHRLDETLRYAKRLGVKAKVHIEVETGMHRTGFEQEELSAVMERIRSNSEHFEVVGLFTHFAGAESLINDVRVRGQAKKFSSAHKEFKSNSIDPQYAHQACSAVMMNYPDSIDGMARVGIMQYGFWPNQETWFRHSAASGVTKDPLRRLISWTSRVMAISLVAAGEYVGYGVTCEAQRDLRVAVIPVGYSHGFDRGLSNAGRVLIRGHLAPVIGIVNMNAICVDVTDVPGAERGDEVVLIGEQNGHQISVASFSEMSEQLNYEMLTRLPRDIPRIITE